MWLDMLKYKDYISLHYPFMCETISIAEGLLADTIANWEGYVKEDKRIYISFLLQEAKDMGLIDSHELWEFRTVLAREELG